jgi:two-component system, OmpR family, sensor kinase
VNRLPIRVRLALAFALAMAIVLAVVGSLLYVRLGDSLLEQVDDNLERLAFETIVEHGNDDGELRQFSDEELVQILGADAIGQPALIEPAISEAEWRRAEGGPFYLTRAVSGVEGMARLYVRRFELDEPYVVVVGASLEDRQEALDGLLAQLFIVGPLALVLTALGGYLLAGAALRPVEAMRGRAAEISTDASGRRLPLPRARDEIRSLGETLNEMVGRLEEGVARERRFVADASHELRTPLALLQTELELASRRPRSREELEVALGSAREEVERLVRLAEDLLVLARAEDGRLPLSRESHIVREVLDSVAGRFDSRAGEAGREIVVDAPEDSVLVGDRLRLEQALGNLVDNALRHGAGTIRLEAVDVAAVIVLRVSDEGPGFPDDFLTHAFERFSRADVARAGGGAGLGLAIVDAIARAHGGTATAKNSANGGATVTLSVPAASFADAHPALI